MIKIKYDKKYIESLFKTWLQKRSFGLRQCIKECKSNSILRKRKEKKVLRRNFFLLCRACEEFGNSPGRYLTELVESNNGSILSISVISSYYVFDHESVRNKKEMKLTLILNIKAERFNARANEEKEVGLIGIENANKKFLVKAMSNLYKNKLFEEQKEPGLEYIKCW